MALQRLRTPERIIAWRLLEGRVVSAQEMIVALWDDDADGGPLTADGIVKLRIMSLRMKFAEVGVQIENIWSFGYRIIPEHLGRAQDALADEIAMYGPVFNVPGRPSVLRRRIKTEAA